MRRALILLLALSLAALADEPVDKAWHGKVLRVRGNEVTLFYDFSDEEQLLDFEEVRLPHLPAGTAARVSVEDGDLRLKGTGALRHKAFGLGTCRAQFTVRITLRGSEGAFLAPPEVPGRYLLLNLYDRGQKRDGGLLLAHCEPGAAKQPVIWRPVASAAGAEVDKRIAGDAPAELEVSVRGGEVYCRLGDLYRQRPTEPFERVGIGFWVHESGLSVDDLTITVPLSGEPSLTGDSMIAELSVPKLANLVMEAPLSRDAAFARRELSARGEEGWKRIETTVRKMDKTQAYAAVPLVEALAWGTEDGRREPLLVIHGKTKSPELHLAALLALAEWYPADAELLHAGLLAGLPGRLRLFRELVPRGLPVEAIKPLTEDAELSGDAAAVLMDRGAQLEESELGRLPRIRALEGYSPAACRAFMKEFGDAPNWPLVEALVDLLDDKDREVATGAHLLLLTLSGKDIAPIKDFWRSWIAAKRSGYEPPHLSEPGVVTAAIQRGTDFLRKDLLQDGMCVWPVAAESTECIVGATALGIVALRAAGVPRDDAAITKAMQETLLVVGPDGRPALRGNLRGYTYAYSLLAMALESVDKDGSYKQLLQVIARRLTDGQLPNGQWTYHCEPKEYARRPKAGDNSNTQYAILGLRAARRAGVEIDKNVWLKNAAFWHSAMNGKGGWGYGPGGSFDHELSMTAAGVATLGICAESLHGLKAWDLVRGDKRIVTGMHRLGELLLKGGYEGQEIYAFYGVERACILTGTRAFDDFDWYREGAAFLVTTQKESGAWGKKDPHGITEGDGYGEGIDTAYALLFLKRATTGLPGAEGGGTVKVKRR